jgi:hypothetical protein
MYYELWWSLDYASNFICYFDKQNVLLYSSLVVLSIYNFDDDGYLIMYVILCYIILLTCSIFEADASMDFVELQINEWIVVIVQMVSVKMGTLYFVHNALLFYKHEQSL